MYTYHGFTFRPTGKRWYRRQRLLQYRVFHAAAEAAEAAAAAPLRPRPSPRISVTRVFAGYDEAAQILSPSLLLFPCSS